MKNILVLGGTGFVGSHVCEKLVQQGWSVTVPTRRLSNAQRVQLLPGLTVLQMDVHDPHALTQAVAGHDAVVNLVAILHGNAAAFDKAHVVLPQKLVKACHAAGVNRVVHVSALGANDQRPGTAPSEYLRSKGRGEAALLHPGDAASALNVSVLRPSVIFGAEDRFLNTFARLQALFPVMPLACAHARFQPVWVQDVATAVVRLLERDGDVMHRQNVPRILEACGPQVYTLAELVQLAAELSGVNEGRGRPIIPLPNWLGRIQAGLMELSLGEPLMSRDNLDSMQVDNVASGQVPGLQALDITPSALVPIADDYLKRNQADYGLSGLRKRAH
ncbi:complex I NDUFA9 subunit family protein [Candidatus Aalborgicola defluviihabitans]|uniref:complex I NDUFA9 subunit family protein n=1 Tax=Candidatus Aalborgicola defluviihabitans TaxID=3386187 RepID=UPI0039094433|nr:complex I NDUFA9 subunit family protein [Burkholderiales bacterium]